MAAAVKRYRSDGPASRSNLGRLRESARACMTVVRWSWPGEDLAIAMGPKFYCKCLRRKLLWEGNLRKCILTGTTGGLTVS